MTSILCKFSAKDVAPPQGSKCQAQSHIGKKGSAMKTKQTAGKIAVDLPADCPRSVGVIESPCYDPGAGAVVTNVVHYPHKRSKLNMACLQCDITILH